MADRLDWGFGQVVSAGDMDLQGDQLEQQLRDFAVDMGLSLTDLSLTDGGIISGLLPSAPAPGSMLIPVTLGAAYDNLGRRIRAAAGLSVDVSASGNTAIGVGGLPTGGASTTPGVGTERWISIFIESARLLSDPRIDGTGATVQFRRGESFRFVVTQSGDLVAPAAPGSRPAMEAGRLLLADVRRDPTNVLEVVTYGPSIGAGDGRRQVWFRKRNVSVATTRVGAGFPVRGAQATETIRGLLELILGYYNDHARDDASTADRHVARQISNDASGNWADADTNPAIAAGVGAGSGGCGDQPPRHQQGAGIKGDTGDAVDDGHRHRQRPAVGHER